MRLIRSVISIGVPVVLVTLYAAIYAASVEKTVYFCFSFPYVPGPDDTFPMYRTPWGYWDYPYSLVFEPAYMIDRDYIRSDYWCDPTED